MPRHSRSLSDSGYYHVIARGNGKQLVFEESDDYRFYLNRLEKYSGETGVSVCAYCLMDNHVHLLLHDRTGDITQFMKKLNGSYAQFFNWKYKRSGHLFQDRYRSEPIEDDSYFLSVLHYILNNPRKAGICGAEQYPWCSYKLYEAASFIDNELIKGLLPSIEEYEEFIMMQRTDRKSPSEMERRDDEWAKTIIKERLGVESGTAVQGFERAKRDEAIEMLLKEGLSERQIERLTGVSRYIIRRIAW